MANQWCGYTGKSAWLDWYQMHRDEIVKDRGADTTWLYVPVTVQIVGDNSGNGYFPFENAIRALCEMNENFAVAHIRFYFVPDDAVRYLNNSAWYQHEFSGGSQLINQNKLPNRLNAFVVGDPAGNCGYAWQNAIVLGKNCSGANNTTWTHEAGHHLSLPHPFSGWEGFQWNYAQPAPDEIGGHEVEKTDGSNCYFSGDGFCDTKPDYLNDRWNCNSNKESTILQHDPNGEEFRSDASLYMGYADDNCATRFTEEQIEAMRFNLYDEHESYINQTPPFTEIDDDAVVGLVSPIDSQYVQYNNVTLTWNLIPDAKFYVVEISPLPSFSPRVFYQVFSPPTTSTTVKKGLLNNWNMHWRVRAYNEWDICQPYDNVQIGVFRTKNLTATNDLERLVLAELSPNPVPGGHPAVLNITSDESMDVSMLVADAAGRVCQNQAIRLSPGENSIGIPTDHLSAGFYVVHMHNEKGSFMKRFVVTD
ncbi:MAG: T9SS type A sorting domain-containing protein [Lewinellaceae bacterium]|nr:T9SS type A sorting domain-containing protein [Lewinellaceae bacterium]